MSGYGYVKVRELCEKKKLWSLVAALYWAVTVLESNPAELMV